MRFAFTKELKKFLIKENIFPEFVFMHEISIGGSSYNFYVKTTANEYFLKVMENTDDYEKLSKILQTLKFNIILSKNNFKNYKLLAMPYIKGKKMRYKNFTNDNFIAILNTYNDLQKIKIPLNKMTNEIKKTLTEIDYIFRQQANDMNIFYKLIYKKFWLKIRNNLINLPTSNVIIHGDLTANNILIDSQGKANIIDFDNLRYGHKSEDFTGLILQLSGFRGIFGSIRKFKKLTKIINENKSFSREEWLYGVQLFYLHALQRKLYSLRYSNLRKSFCFLISILGYFRIIKNLPD